VTVEPQSIAVGQASAREIQQRVRAATDLGCSVGIGQNKLQAKLATGLGKCGQRWSVRSEPAVTGLSGGPALQPINRAPEDH
jgi:nucleotidyltransferase/DNA polymerase involved in DNA repair